MHTIYAHHQYVEPNFVLLYTIGGGWMICNFSIILVHFVFLLIEFHCTFSISFKILQYFIYYNYI